MANPSDLEPPSVETIPSQLQSWMQAAGIPSFRALARESGVSRRQVDRLRRGEVQALSVQTAGQIAQALRIPVTALIQGQGSAEMILDSGREAALRAECQRLQEALSHQKDRLQASFQAEALHILESFLLYWPMAALKAQQDPTFPASRLITLVKPMEVLLEAWEVTAIASVGAILPYDPTVHQWIETTPAPAVGERVQVSHGGYRHRGQLLSRAKVRKVEQV